MLILSRWFALLTDHRATLNPGDRLLSQLFYESFHRWERHARALELNEGLYEGLLVYTLRQLTLLGHHHDLPLDLFVLLTLLDQEVVTALGLRARIFALHIFLKFLLVDNVLIRDDFSVLVGFLRFFLGARRSSI